MIFLAGAPLHLPLSLSLAHAMMATRVALAGGLPRTGVHRDCRQGLNAGDESDVAAFAKSSQMPHTDAAGYRQHHSVGTVTAVAAGSITTALALATDSFKQAVWTTIAAALWPVMGMAMRSIALRWRARGFDARAEG